VVPAGAANWSQDPFKAGVVDDFIFGRGAIDVKNTALAIMEALEHRIKTGERPRRTLYLALGHDEEVLGLNGAREMAKVLEAMLSQHGEKLAFILDEGTFVFDGAFPGVNKPVALLSVAEKGYLTVNLTAFDQQRHSSVPAGPGVTGRLSAALARVANSPQKARLSGPLLDSLAFLAPHAAFLPYRLLMANAWLTAPLMMVMTSSPYMDALLRTTTAVTVIEAGVKENVIPASASALINLRIHPDDTLEGVLAHLAAAVADETIRLDVVDYYNASAVSSYGTDSSPFQILANTVGDIFPEAVLAPNVLVGGTDSKHYAHLCDDIYRFSPVRLTSEAAAMFHGVDEKIGVEAYERVFQFYYRFDLYRHKVNHND